MKKTQIGLILTVIQKRYGLFWDMEFSRAEQKSHEYNIFSFYYLPSLYNETPNGITAENLLSHVIV